MEPRLYSGRSVTLERTHVPWTR